MNHKKREAEDLREDRLHNAFFFYYNQNYSIKKENLNRFMIEENLQMWMIWASTLIKNFLIKNLFKFLRKLYSKHWKKILQSLCSAVSSTKAFVINASNFPRSFSNKFSWEQKLYFPWKIIKFCCLTLPDSCRNKNCNATISEQGILKLSSALRISPSPRTRTMLCNLFHLSRKI